MHKLCASRIIVNVTTIISRAKLRSLDQEPAQFHLGSSHSNFDLWSSCITTSNIQSLFACGTNTLPFLKTTCNREVPTPKYRHLQNPLFSIAGNFSTFARLVFITQVLNMSISHGKILSLWSNLQLHCEMDIQIESFDQKKLTCNEMHENAANEVLCKKWKYAVRGHAPSETAGTYICSIHSRKFVVPCILPTKYLLSTPSREESAARNRLQNFNFKFEHLSP